MVGVKMTQTCSRSVMCEEWCKAEPIVIKGVLHFLRIYACDYYRGILAQVGSEAPFYLYPFFKCNKCNKCKTVVTTKGYGLHIGLHLLRLACYTLPPWAAPEHANPSIPSPKKSNKLLVRGSRAPTP